MKIILSRHGNTFGPGTPAVWIGCNNDLPLVKSGSEQAKILAKVLNQAKITLSMVYCGALRRTISYAQIVLDELRSNIRLTIDPRLNELNYGLWSGLTSQQIYERFGNDDLEKWERSGRWPTKAKWGQSEDFARNEILSFVFDICNKHAEGDVVLVISSNGKLRYFMSLVQGAFDNHVNGLLKVKTGNICKLDYSNNEWKLDYWNESPNLKLFIEGNIS